MGLVLIKRQLEKESRRKAAALFNAMQPETCDYGSPHLSPLVWMQKKTGS